MSAGAWINQALHAVARFGVADLLGHGPASADDLAARLDVQPRPLYRLLRALAGLGVFHQEPDGRFALTPLGAPLRTDAPNSVRHTLLMLGGEQYRAWASFQDAIRLGGTAFAHHHGVGVFEYYRDRPEESAIFNAAMRELSRDEDPIISHTHDFARATRVMDVGGGTGGLLSRLLADHAHLSGVLFDQPATVGLARDRGELPVDRCVLVGGDFRDTVPRGADLIVVKNTLHNWADDDVVAILRNCRAALPAGGELLVCERTIGEPNQPSFAHLLDLHMMATPGGQVRTVGEHAALLREAGLLLTGHVPTAAIDIMTASPA
ncbi:methyltransferase [Actinomadura hibisca]|uniref:methyltransferase n=1 Tax=Actinomadura hibisca TaxID=68565 RepID=UPI000ACC2434|nr:methyltransferase [Actinomadura hibisca]